MGKRAIKGGVHVFFFSSSSSPDANKRVSARSELRVKWEKSCSRKVFRRLQKQREEKEEPPSTRRRLVRENLPQAWHVYGPLERLR